MMILIAAAICIVSQVNGADPTLGAALTDKGLTTLAKALTDNNLVAALEGLSDVTVFAPSEAAFTAFGDLPTGDALVEALKYHVVTQRIMSTDITNNLMKESFDTAKNKIRFNIYENEPTVYTAQGAVIDTSTGMVNIKVANGYIHIVNSVMTAPTQNVYEVASGTDFSKLKTAIDNAGLKETLEAAGPYTVFAPNDVAAGDKLDISNTTILANALKYHVVGAVAFSAGLKNNQEFETVEGSKIKIIIDDGKVYLNSKDEAQVITPDVSTTNGVIHVINNVLAIPTTGGDTSGAAMTVCSIVTALSVAFFATLSVL